ncbi:MAG: DNA polymerase I [Verrucomicrobia bacterium]|nr:MAG: DNA polymerase I [Verrucomicrobiota bacterium]PYJ97016.1 MAG: DNA polymerase I [Verrucomicrobiota bacterium]
MKKRLFLLDGMALVYRAHFALVSRPIFTSKGANTSALFVFTNTLLDILSNQQPTHIAVAFDTEAPTERHREFPEYKIQREAMPEDIVWALPHVQRLLEAFNIPALVCDGYEADDIIGTLVRRAEKQSFESYLVTPDKDFGQLVSERNFIYKPGRMGDAAEILRLPEVRAKWGVERPEQVIDIIGLWGDVSDNIPGVPGIGEKTAGKLINQYGSVENLLAHTAELKGKLRQNLEEHRDRALLSKRLATINCEVPIDVDFEKLKLHPPDEAKLKQMLVEFEFNSIGRRLFGDDFKAGRGLETPATGTASRAPANEVSSEEAGPAAESPVVEEKKANLKTLADVAHDYQVVSTVKARADLVRTLAGKSSFALGLRTDGADPRQARLIGLAFVCEARAGWFVPMPRVADQATALLNEFRLVFEDERIEKVGYDLKFVLGALKWAGVSVRGRMFDVMLAHALIEPDLRHSIEFLSEAFLGYTPAASSTTQVGQGELSLSDSQASGEAEHAVEAVDLIWQLRSVLKPLLKEKSQERVFYEIEAPLVPVLVNVEFDGVRVDGRVLAEFAELLGKEMAGHERAIYRLAGVEFNLNSPKQLGEVLFEKLKVAGAPKKTKTGQYATDEQTLIALAGEHEIVRHLLEYRECSKLKSTYVDALPAAIFTKTGRVHTTFHQLATATGRLNSQNPNLQNIPIRTKLGREIRKAFVPREEDYLLLSADYSQIELRVIAALSRETSMIEALKSGADIHVATASRVFGVPQNDVTPEMRERCKMVNYGIAYGMSAFGLAQRLGIPRKEAAAIIDHYFAQFPGIRKYMTDTIEFARQHGYVETITGRRRYLRDIRSANASVRGAAERNAINTPIQGTAADMIKLAMVHIHRELAARKLKTKMILQVHDELVFDLYRAEQEEVMALVEDKMKTAIRLDVPIVVEIGVGKNWLEAH